MIEFLFIIAMIWIFSKLFLFGVRAAWGISKMLLTVVFLPLLLVILLICGLLYLAVPILVIVGIAALVTND